MPACVRVHAHLANRCSFTLCQSNVYISGETGINFLHVETRSYDCICMYICTAVSEEAALSTVGVLPAHLYKWLFWQVSWVQITLFPCKSKNPLNMHGLTNMCTPTHTHTHTAWHNKDFVLFCTTIPLCTCLLCLLGWVSWYNCLCVLFFRVCVCVCVSLHVYLCVFQLFYSLTTLHTSKCLVYYVLKLRILTEWPQLFS